MSPPSVEIDFLGVQHRRFPPVSVAPAPRHAYGIGPAPPSINPSYRTAATEPLTIFYNGTVYVFNVCPDEAEAVMKMAESAAAAAAAPPRMIGGFGISFLPLARQKSLQRFLERRRERLIATSPYPIPSTFSTTDSDSSMKKKTGFWKHKLWV